MRRMGAPPYFKHAKIVLSSIRRSVIFISFCAKPEYVRRKRLPSVMVRVRVHARGSL